MPSRWAPPTIWGSISPRLNVSENLPLIGLIYMVGLFPAFVLMLPELIVPSAVLLFFGLMSSKFMPMLVPFLAVAMAKGFDKLEFKHVNLRYAFLFIPIVLLANAVYQMPTMPPNATEVGAVEFALLQADGNRICNDWDTGSWIQFYSGNDLQYERIHGIPNPNYADCNGTALSSKDLAVYGCSETKQFGYLKVWRC
jgi:hypothetical protein